MSGASAANSAGCAAGQTEAQATKVRNASAKVFIGNQPQRGERRRQVITECARKNHPAIDGASIGAAGSTTTGGRSLIDNARWIGRRMVKREPSPSLLFTSTPPPCRSTAILTR